MAVLERTVSNELAECGSGRHIVVAQETTTPSHRDAFYGGTALVRRAARAWAAMKPVSAGSRLLCHIFFIEALVLEKDLRAELRSRP